MNRESITVHKGWRKDFDPRRTCSAHDLGFKQCYNCGAPIPDLVRREIVTLQRAKGGGRYRGGSDPLKT
jgi:hypothetical protein